MKTLRRLLVLFPLLATLALATDNLPIFRGIISAGKDSKFGLTSAVGGPTAWVSVGDTFEGWTIDDYHAKSQSLVLKNGTKEVTVALAGSGGGQDAADDVKASLAQANDVLKKMNFDQMMAKMLDQQKKASADMIKQMMGQMAPGNTSPEDMAAIQQFQQQMMDQMMAALNPAEMHDDIAKAYADTFTGEELDGLSAFYSTPTGQALADKTPALQARIQQVMMPRIMSVMPAIQQSAQSFGRQMAARKASSPPAQPSP
jgi:hypothetical protein